METYSATQLYHGNTGDLSTSTLLWGAAVVLVLAGAWVLASKAIERLRKRKHPQREDEVWR